MSLKRFQSIVSLIVLGGLLSACATNPVTGKREFSLLSEGQEVQLGAESDPAIIAQYGLLNDPEVTAYVQNIGGRMVPVSHRPDLAFNFRVLDDPIVNAFALPGGYVYITRGILAYLNSEAALAGVVGHEIGHVTARHGVQRYTQQAIVGLGIGIGSVLSEGFAQYADAASGAAGLLLLKYGRNDERESDELGVQYATALGYNTHDMAEFFHTLDRLTPGEGRLPAWASTHPDPGERWNTVHALTTQTQSAQGRYEEGRERYLQTIDGIVFGTDPREGFFRDDFFYHPQLRFQFPVPSGWQRQNGKSQILMVAANEAAAAIFQAAQGASPEAAADAFVGQEGMTVLDRRGVTIAGKAGVRTVVRGATASGVQVIGSTFFPYGGGQWVIHGIAGEDTFGQWQRTLESISNGFEPLSDPAILGVKPVRVKVVSAPRTASFAEIVSKYPIPEGAMIETVEELAILNGMEATATVGAGTLLKVLAR